MERNILTWGLVLCAIIVVLMTVLSLAQIWHGLRSILGPLGVLGS